MPHGTIHTMLKRTKSFTDLYTRLGFVLLVVLAVAMTGIDIYESYRDFDRRAGKMREDFIASQKKIIKEEVLRAVSMIDYRLSEVDKTAEREVSEYVNRLYGMAADLYSGYSRKIGSSTVEAIIADMFNSQAGGTAGISLYIMNTAGKFITSSAGFPPVSGKEIIDAALSKGEGNLDLSAGAEVRVILHYRYFKPLGLIMIGLADKKTVEERIKRDILTEISMIRFGSEGYIFVNSFDGDALVANGKILGGEKKLWEVFNSNPDGTRELFGKELNAARKKNGDYIYYHFVKLNNSGIKSPKASYILGLPSLKWLVGAGVYLDDVESEINNIRRDLVLQVKGKVMHSLVIIGVVVLLLFLFFRRLTSRFRSEFNDFLSFFSEAADKGSEIDKGKLIFSEFEQLAVDANKVLNEKKQMQLELREEREQLFVTIHSIGDGVITTDVSGNIEMMNKVAEELTGWKEEEAAGKSVESVFKIIGGETGENLETPVSRVLREKKTVSLKGKTLLISKDGIRRSIEDSAAPIMAGSGDIRGVVLVFRDVTEKLKIEKELERARSMETVGILAGGIVHDFNNILTGLFGNIELARLKTGKDHPAYSYLEDADKALNRATNLTMQLMTLAKGGNTVVEAVDLKMLLNEVAKFNLTGSPVEYSIDTDEDLWNVKADRGQLSQIIANLTINAKQAMPDGGTLYISAENKTGPEDFVRITFRDEGEGIPPEIAEKIFDPYYTTKDTGSGLGLAVVQSIIEKHNGKIAMESAPGRGTVFTLLLPAEKDMVLSGVISGED